MYKLKQQIIRLQKNIKTKQNKINQLQKNIKQKEENIKQQQQDNIKQQDIIKQKDNIIAQLKNNNYNFNKNYDEIEYSLIPLPLNDSKTIYNTFSKIDE